MRKLIFYLSAVLVLVSFSLVLSAQDQPTAAGLYNEGLAQMKAKAFTEALPLFMEAIEKADPENEYDAKVVSLARKNGAIAAYYVGSDLRKEENYEGAMEKFDLGIGYDPGFYANYIGRAQTLEGLGQTVEAVKAYVNAAAASKAAGKEDRSDQLISKAENFAALAYADENWEAVMSHAQAFLELNETGDTHFYRAYALKETGMYEKAIEHAEKGMELDQGEDMGRYRMVKAGSLEKMGKKEEAIAVYQSITSGKYAERAKYNADQLSGGK